jgi:hypothetical protein
MTPSAYGLELDASNFLVGGSVPTGTTAVEKTYTISATDYVYHFNRLWRFTGTQLIYSAPEYTSVYYPSGIGHLDFNEDTNSITKIVPLQNSLVAFKTTGAFMVPNQPDQRGNFDHQDIIQEAALAAANQAVELDNVIYISNATGLTALLPSGETVEVTAPVRGGSVFVNVALTANYVKKWIIGGTSYVYDVTNKKIFDYSTAGFLYQTPSLRVRGKGLAGAPFTISDMAFEVTHTGTSDGTIAFQTQFDARGWNTEDTVQVYYDRGTTERVSQSLQVQENARAFAMQVTALSGVKLRRILVRSSDFTQDSFDS